MSSKDKKKETTDFDSFPEQYKKADLFTLMDHSLTLQLMWQNRLKEGDITPEEVNKLRKLIDTMRPYYEKYPYLISKVRNFSIHNSIHTYGVFDKISNLELYQLIEEMDFENKLKSIKKSVRLQALLTLYGKEDDEIDLNNLSNLILKRIDDLNPDVRYWAIRIVGKFKIKEAIPKLINRLGNDRKYKVRCQAAWSLGLIGDEIVTTALIDAKNDKNSQVRNYADKALVILKEKGSIGDDELALIKDIRKEMTDDELRALNHQQKREFSKESFWMKHGGQIIVGALVLIGVILQVIFGVKG